MNYPGVAACQFPGVRYTGAQQVKNAGYDALPTSKIDPGDYVEQGPIIMTMARHINLIIYQYLIRALVAGLSPQSITRHN